jgi:hemerythrin-like domain-containing protein
MSSKAIEMLMEEHQVILKVLGSLESFTDALEKGKEADRATVKKYAEFLRNFADLCHHGKEEDRLFVKMNDFGIPRGDGPVAVMLHEHEAGRAHVRALMAIGEKSGPLSLQERKEVTEHGRDFIDLLQNHIVKEDRILYPLAEKAIPVQELEKLNEDFEQFEREVTGKGEHEKWHALAQELIQAHPPQQHHS